MRPSTYNPDRAPELARLAAHAAHLRDFDRQLITAAAAHTATVVRGLLAVDLGCADGSVTLDRFGGRRFAHVLGVDRNPDLIAKANESAAGDPRFTFVALDLETADLEREVRVWAEQRSRSDVDVVFSALAVHHLGDPTAVLGAAKAVTASPGSIIVRSTDDGSKIAWPDPDGDLERIIHLTATTAGVSDRFHGRKLMQQLTDAGYHGVTVEQHHLSTSGRTEAERLALLHESFSYRTESLAQAVRDQPGSADNELRLSELIRRLHTFGARFTDPGFWYSETVSAGVGRA
jgi:SAM-dependent methyltransferase